MKAMDRISYANHPAEDSIRVYLGRKHIGDIKPTTAGYYYQPANTDRSFGGDTFRTVAEVKASIE